MTPPPKLPQKVDANAMSPWDMVAEDGFASTTHTTGLTSQPHGQSGREVNRPSEGSIDPEAHLPSICLKQVFPKYAKQFNYLRLVDRLANLFIRFLGVKGTMKLGPTGFRTFIRASQAELLSCGKKVIQRTLIG
ncbi:hypothetical protein MC885_000049 [Smutsia gigantea]|nr:hypothetical protein MC885_000049 [Smutsia gigantea]